MRAGRKAYVVCIHLHRRDYAKAMIKRYGGTTLAATVEPALKVASEHGERVGLVVAVPYTPRPPDRAPFVGAFGTFAKHVYLED